MCIGLPFVDFCFSVQCAMNPFGIGDDLMATVMQFGEVLDAADHLSRDEQEELIGILHRRLAQASRQRLVAEIKEARQEFAEGRCLPMTPGELMREITK